MRRVIVVPLDGSRGALTVLPVERTLAEVLRATPQFLHVRAADEEPLPTEALVTRLGLLGDDVRACVVEQRAGEPAAAIVKVAAEQRAQAIVMCTHAGRPSLLGGLGHTARRVLDDAPCPVVLVRPGFDGDPAAPWRLRHMLLPHDGAPTTTEIVRPVVELARASGARVSVLHVAVPHGDRTAGGPAGAAARANGREPHGEAQGAPVGEPQRESRREPRREPGALPAPRYVDQRQHEWPAWATEFVERLAGVAGLAGVEPQKLHLALGAGEPSEEVLRYARAHDVDLIVLAWGGALTDARAAVVRTLLVEAPCPLMIFKA